MTEAVETPQLPGDHRPGAAKARGPGGQGRFGPLLGLSLLIAALFAIPIVSVVGSLFAEGQGTWAHLAETVLPRYLWKHRLAGPGGRAGRVGDRRDHRLADHDVPLPGTAGLRMGHDPAAGGARLRHGLRLHRLPPVQRSPAVPDSGADRLDAPGLLVPLGPLAGRGHRHAVAGPLSLRLPARPDRLPRAVGLRPGGQPDLGAARPGAASTGSPCPWPGRRSRPAPRWP